MEREFDFSQENAEEGITKIPEYASKQEELDALEAEYAEANKVAEEAVRAAENDEGKVNEAAILTRKATELMIKLEPLRREVAKETQNIEENIEN